MEFFVIVHHPEHGTVLYGPGTDDQCREFLESLPETINAEISGVQPFPDVENIVEVEGD